MAGKIGWAGAIPCLKAIIFSKLPGMKYTPLVPHASLSGLVNYFWVAEADGKQTAPYTYLSTADSCPKLVFPYPLY
jgi:hypothetical protein